MANIMDGLKKKWSEVQEDIQTRKQESTKQLQHDQVPLRNPRGPANERSPMERFHPAGADAARQVEEWRRTQPQDGERKVPAKLTPQPVGPGYGNGPTVAQSGVEYGPAQPAVEKNASRQPAAIPEVHPQASRNYREPEPAVHERLARKLDRATDKDLAAVAHQRSETVKKLDFERKLSR